MLKVYLLNKLLFLEGVVFSGNDKELMLPEVTFDCFGNTFLLGEFSNALLFGVVPRFLESDGFKADLFRSQ